MEYFPFGPLFVEPAELAADSPLALPDPLDVAQTDTDDDAGYFDLSQAG